MRSLLVCVAALAAVPVLAADSEGPVDGWAYVEVDDARGKWGDTDEPDWLRYFGIDAADLDADGDLDIVSGRYVYRNPGGKMEAWERVDLGTNADAVVVVDVDGDAHADVIAQALPKVVWLEAEGPDLQAWRPTVIGTLPKTGHINGQGYGKGDLDGDGRPEVLLTAADGIYAAVIPKDPGAGPWPWVRVVERGTDEGFAVVDMDGDGDADLVGGDGPPGDEEPTLVAWWANPGSLDGAWRKHVVGETAHAVDRVIAGDLNGDGRVDVAVSEERYPGKEPDAHLWWFEATPAGPTTPFARHLLVQQYSMNNLDAGDLDGDGDVDLVTGEHKGPDLRLQIFENDGQGGFTLREIDRGKECHLGTRLYDLDGDGDLDIVGHAWDEWRYLHLWRNDAPAGEGDAGELAERLLELHQDYRPRSMLQTPERPVSRARFPVADVHCHWSAEVAPEDLVADMDRLGVSYAVNLSGGWGDQLDALLERYEGFAPDRFEILVNVDFSEIDEPDFGSKWAGFLEQAKAKGAAGLKIFKDLGLTIRDGSGRVVPIDDPRIDPIWAKCGELGMPVLIHSADPLAFFEPIDRFNERLMQLGRHPDWSFYGTEFPAREEVLAQRNRVLAKHPGTRFIGAHLGGYAEDLAALGRVLDRYPNFVVDISGRVAELGRQPYTARRFFLKYPDRIVFGTDRYPGRASQPRYRPYYRFLETDDEYFEYHEHDFPPTGEWRIHGIFLPDDVLKQVYHLNADKLFRP